MAEMLERDLNLVVSIHKEINTICDALKMHEEYRKYLSICFQIPQADDPRIPSSQIVYEPASVGILLGLKDEEIHQKCNTIITEMLQKRIAEKRAELAKLGIRLEDDTPKLPRRKKERLRLTDMSAKGNGPEGRK